MEARHARAAVRRTSAGRSRRIAFIPSGSGRPVRAFQTFPRSWTTRSPSSAAVSWPSWITSAASTSPRFAAAPTALKSITTGSCSGSASRSASAALVRRPGIAMRLPASASSDVTVAPSGTTTVGP